MPSADILQLLWRPDLYKNMRDVSDVYEAEGRGKELVSVYVAESETLSNVVSIIEDKIDGLDEFEKNQRMRYSLERTLELVKEELNQFDSVPKNGIVVFSGRVDGDSQSICFSNELEDPIYNTRFARGRKFLTEPIKSRLSVETQYLLVVLELGECLVGSLRGDSANLLDRIEEDVPSKHSKGGQSQARFERRREQVKNRFYGKVSKRIEKIAESNSIDNIFLGGTEITVKEFLNEWSRSDNYEVEICSSVEYTNVTGLNRVAERAVEHRNDRQTQTEVSHIEGFFSALESSDEPVVYGKDRVERAIDLHAISKLLIHDDVYEEDLVNRAESIGSDVVVIKNESEKSRMFKRGFGGIGAELRYEISS